MSTPLIFVSHSHFDNDFCRRLIDYLHQHLPGVEIFFDEGELRGGDEWFRRIQHAVIAAPIFIVLLSRHSVVAEWVAEETNLALSRAIKDRSRRVIPVKIDAALEFDAIDHLAPALTLRQVVDLSGSAPKQNWEALLRMVRGEIPGMATPVNHAHAQGLEEAREYVNQVREAIQSQQWLTAVRLGRYAVTLPGNDRDAALWGDYGRALIMTGDVEQGLAALDAALKLNRARSDLWRLKAQTLLQQGMLDDAIASWGMAFVVTVALSRRLEILAEQCQALQQAQRWQDASRVAAEALQLAADDIAWRQTQEQIRVQMRQSIMPERLLQWLGDLGYRMNVIDGIDVIIPPVCTVPDGLFTMGDGSDNDNQSHGVMLPAYQIGIFPLTVAEYACAVLAGSVAEPAADNWKSLSWQDQLRRPNHPVVNITWFQATAYAKWLARVTGEAWHLPAEAEWAKAARGTDERSFPWGKRWDNERANTVESGIGTTTAVGSYPNGASPYGAQDMAGNVWEWCSSLYRPYPFRSDDGREDPRDAMNNRVLRGGSWADSARLARVTFRLRNQPDTVLAAYGTRLALAGPIQS
jgi:formylglycine-generating enzyme required for sulfatase activity